MAKAKMLTLPKKPKSNASAQTMENYLQKVAIIKKTNLDRAKDNAKLEKLKKAISGITRASVLPGTGSRSAVSGTRKRKAAPKKKAAPKRKPAKKTARKR